MREDKMREIGHQVLHLINNSGLTIEEQLFVVDGLHWSLHQAVKDITATLQHKDENSN